jgi:cobalt-zinc-cadmium resistance protein CzcA
MERALGPPEDHHPDHHRGDFLPALPALQFAAFATLIITVLPFASIGGIIGLFVSGEYLSVPASVGFIALWGIAVLNGVVLVSYIRGCAKRGGACVTRWWKVPRYVSGR